MLKKHQKVLGVKADGRITPDLVFLLLCEANSLDTLFAMNRVFTKPVYLKTYQNKKWPNQI